MGVPLDVPWVGGLEETPAQGREESGRDEVIRCPLAADIRNPGHPRYRVGERQWHSLRYGASSEGRADTSGL